MAERKYISLRNIYIAQDNENVTKVIDELVRTIICDAQAVKANFNTSELFRIALTTHMIYFKSDYKNQKDYKKKLNDLIINAVETITNRRTFHISHESLHYDSRVEGIIRDLWHFKASQRLSETQTRERIHTLNTTIIK